MSLRGGRQPDEAISNRQAEAARGEIAHLPHLHCDVRSAAQVWRAVPGSGEYALATTCESTLRRPWEPPDLLTKRSYNLRMATLEHALAKLHAHAHPDQLAGMAKFGIVGDERLGLSVPEMRKIAKELKRDHSLALALWDTGIPEAMMVASMIDDPKQLTEAQMDDWVEDFMSWDVCDQVCGNLFDKSPLAWKKVTEWSTREEEFVKRAAFALIAYLAWHNKTSPDEKFTALFPLIERAATDARNFVKKAVNWALRGVGKRNRALNAASIEMAGKLAQMDSKSARWIASDALRELTGDAVQKRLG